MSGTFSSFNTGLSALRYNRVAMDIASSNIANVTTEGFVRRRVDAESVGAPPVAALWSRYAGHGDGVRVTGVSRLADPFLDARARTEHGNQSYLTTTKAVLDRIETGIGEPGDDGVAAALAEFRSSWHDLANNPGGSAARSQVLTRAAGLVEAIRVQARNITTEQADRSATLDAVLTEVNQLASDLAATNKSIAVGLVNGSDVNSLLDQRDQLALRLAELTGATATPGAQGSLDVRIGGVALVSGDEASTLVRDAAPPASSVSFTVVDASGGTTAVPAGIKGDAGALTDLLNVTLPEYLDGLNQFARTLADEFNTAHAGGFDLAGNPGGTLFTLTAGAEAASLAVAVTDGAELAASGVPGGNLDGGNAGLLGSLRSADDSYQRLVNGFGTQVASLGRLTANQAVITQQVDASRDQLAGINLDEEMTNLVAAQRAYEAASRVISTLDSMLDTLINRTGILR